MNLDWSQARALNRLESHRTLKRYLGSYIKPDDIVVDIGSANKPYQEYVRSHNYFGLDLEGGDVCGDALKLPFKKQVADVVVSTQLLEHLASPTKFFGEVYRILKPGGVVILTAPMMWPLHDEPHDYWRFTPFGLNQLAKQANLEVIRSEPMGGFISAAWQLWALLLERPTYHRGVVRKVYSLFLKICFGLLQPVIAKLDEIKPVYGYSMNLLVIAKKTVD